jgi:glutathione S-transferase
MLRILGRVSSINVRKVLWTCHEIGLSYDREDWGSGFRPTAAPEFLEMNPNGLVPVIQDEEVVLWESNTICRYLAGKHGNTDLLPTTPRKQALVEQWMDWQATELNSAWRYPFLALVRRDPHYRDQEQIETGKREWNKKIGILEKQLLSTAAFIAGDVFTLADIVVGLSVNRWLKTPLERPDYPAVISYYEMLRRRPAFMEHGLNEFP